MTTNAARRAVVEVDPDRQSSHNKPSRSHPEPAAEPRRGRPNLRVLEGGAEPRVARLSPRVRLVALVAMVGVVLFGVVAFHVILSQGEFKLEKMTTKADAQQSQYEKNRLLLSELESPSRITSEAQSLGMVTPDKVTPVTPNAADMPNGVTPSDTRTSSISGSPTSGDPGNWAQVKSQLDSAAQ